MSKSLEGTIVAFQVDDSQFFDGGNVFGGAIVKRGGKSHQGEMRCHGFPAVTCADHCVLNLMVHLATPLKTFMDSFFFVNGFSLVVHHQASASDDLGMDLTQTEGIVDQLRGIQQPAFDGSGQSGRV